MKIRNIITAVLIGLGLGCNRDSDDITQSILNTLKEYDSELSLPSNIPPIHANADLKKAPGAFQYTIEGDHFNTIKNIFMTACGNPEMGVDVSKEGRKDVLFKSKFLVYTVTYLSDTHQTLIFGMGPESKD